jgi:hypothetical protein
MNLMAWMAHHRLVKDWSLHALWLKRAADLFQTWGSDAGAMHVMVQGCTAAGTQVRLQWQLLASDGDGPFAPTLAASALIRKLAAGELSMTGATPCVGLLTLEDFAREWQGLCITTTESTA